MLLSDFKRVIISSYLVNFSRFLILLNLAIPFNSSIAFLCSFLAWFNSFFEVFSILVIFSRLISYNFLRLHLLSYLLRVFNNSLVDIFRGSSIPLFFTTRFYSFLVSFTISILYQDKIKKIMWKNFLYFWEKFFIFARKIFLYLRESLLIIILGIHTVIIYFLLSLLI